MVDRRTVGRWRDVAIDVAGWDGAGAAVDLSCACMFMHEMPGKPMAGGLLHLDQALGGTLRGLRTEQVFRGTIAETLLLSSPPATVAGRALLIIGLGEPEHWQPEVTATAVSIAARAAVYLKAKTAAFAPSLLDAGLSPDQSGKAGEPMMVALATVLDTEHRLASHGLTTSPRLSAWTFDAGVAHLDGAAATFVNALARLSNRT
jgi:hypothetical protein